MLERAPVVGGAVGEAGEALGAACCEECVQVAGKHPDDVLFPGEDGKFKKRGGTSQTSGGWLVGPLGCAGLQRTTVHDLRHTAASLAISAGANVTTVQARLGHASAKMTLDTYADLFPNDLGALAVARCRCIPEVVLRALTGTELQKAKAPTSLCYQRFRRLLPWR